MFTQTTEFISQPTHSVRFVLRKRPPCFNIKRFSHIVVFLDFAWMSEKLEVDYF
jgi:hypothetical protein